MVGLKTNERPGTRAKASYVRSSAYKAREVLDLIRGRSCGDAHDILAFCERAVAEPIAKVLDSALANAEHNDGLDADELYVSACYADEGPTLKRWRPRARGRATRIRKRTCHITVIVSRYDPETLERVRAVQSQRGVAAAEARRRRVARSRAAAQQPQAATDEQVEATDEGADIEDTSAEDTAVGDTAAEADLEAQAAAVAAATETAMAAAAGGEESDEADDADGAAASDEADETAAAEESDKADGSR